MKPKISLQDFYQITFLCQLPPDSEHEIDPEAVLNKIKSDKDVEG